MPRPSRAGEAGGLDHALSRGNGRADDATKSPRPEVAGSSSLDWGLDYRGARTALNIVWQPHSAMVG